MVEEEIRMLCTWKKSEVIELNVQIDHVHLVVSIPPKVSVSEFMGMLKGKLAIKLFKSYLLKPPMGAIQSHLLGRWIFTLSGLT